MRLFPKRSGILTMAIVIVCLLAFGSAEGKVLKLSVRDSVIDMEAREVSLADILQAISAKTGLSLKLGRALTESVSLDMKAMPLEGALKRLLANYNYSLTYRKTADDRFLPEELRVLGGDNVQQAFLPVPLQALDDKRMTPEDPHQKKFDRAWYEQQFRQTSKLASQVAASPYNDGPAPGGIRISSIAPESALKRIGLKAGDVIRDVDGQVVNSTQEFLQMLSSLPVGRTIMRIARKNGNVTDPIYIHLQ